MKENYYNFKIGDLVESSMSPSFLGVIVDIRDRIISPVYVEWLNGPFEVKIFDYEFVDSIVNYIPEEK